MRVLVIGLGKTGSELIKFFESQNADVYVYSDNENDFIDKSYTKYDAKIDYDMIVKCPGVPYEHEVVAQLINSGSNVIDEIELSYRYLRGEIIGITGTNGKSTTTNLLYDIIRNYRDRVFLAGNIGIPLISYVNESKDSDLYVTELSSFQLERVKDFKVKAAIITNVTPDHLNRHGDMDEYIRSKKMILKNIDKEAILVLNADDKLLCNSIEADNYNTKYFSVKNKVDGAYLSDGYFYLYDRKLVAQEETNIVGVHNAMNALAAIIIANSEGVDDATIIKTLKEYKSLDHRYEVIGEKNGIRFINDSKATNPESSMPAIKSAKKPTILIMGGMEKGSDFSELIDEIGSRIDFTLIFGECKRRIEEGFKAKGNNNYRVCEDLDEAFELALSKANKGYDILLSPACASWDMYKSFEVRGNHFRELYGRI